VGDEQDADPTIADLLDQRPGVAACLGIQAGRQLVQHCYPRPADQRQRDRQPLLLPAGQPGEPHVAMLVQPEQLEQLGRVGGVVVERGAIAANLLVRRGFRPLPHTR
jgi:hypothetical protein